MLNPIANLWLVSQLPATETPQCEPAPLSFRGNKNAKANEGNRVVLFLIIPFSLWFIQICLFTSSSLLSHVLDKSTTQGMVKTPGIHLQLHGDSIQANSKPSLPHVSSRPSLRIFHPSALGNIRTKSFFMGFVQATSFLSRATFVPYSTDIPLGFLLPSLL